MASLVYIDDEGVEVFLQLGDEAVTIGRADACTITTRHPGVSRRHCTIAPVEGGGYVIEDDGSSHGTDVNGARVKRARLGDGDRVMCGAGFGLEFFEVP